MVKSFMRPWNNIRASFVATEMVTWNAISPIHSDKDKEYFAGS